MKSFQTIFGLLLLSIIIYTLVQLTIQSNKTLAKYPTISHRDEVSGRIKFLVRERAGIKIEMDDGTCWQLYPLQSYQAGIGNLIDVVREDDVIIKKSNSDSLKLKRFEKTFSFLIRQEE